MNDLTPDEIDMIRLSAEGKSMKDIAQETGIPYYSIPNKRKLLLRKFGVRTITHAVAESIRKNIIQ